MTIRMIGVLSWFCCWHSNAYSYEDETTSLAKIKTEEQDIECRLEFSPNGWDVHIGILKGCFGEFAPTAVESFDIYTTPYPDAKESRHRILWSNRYNAVKSNLIQYFPRAKVNFKSIIDNGSVGESPVIVANLRNPVPNNNINQHSLFPEKLPITTVVLQEIQKQLEKKVPSRNIKIWAGVEFVQVFGSFSSYVPSLFNGYVVGMSNPIKNLDSNNDLYLSIVSDFANTSQNVTVKEQIVQSVYYISDFQFLIGKEHFFSNRNYSFYGDGGLVLVQRAFLVVAEGGVVNNYNIYTHLALGGNTGFNYACNYADKLSFLMKLNLNVLVGWPQSSDVYVNTVSAETVNTNPVIMAPSLSLGIKF